MLKSKFIKFNYWIDYQTMLESNFEGLDGVLKKLSL